MLRTIQSYLSALVDLFFPREKEIMELENPPLRSWKEISLILVILILLIVIAIFIEV